MFSFVSITGIFGSPIRLDDELIASMAIGSSGCFQEGIKFLSNEQQFVLDVPRRLFAYAHATWGCHRVYPAMTALRYSQILWHPDWSRFPRQTFTGRAGMHSAIIRT